MWHLRKESVLMEGLFALIAFGIAFAFIRKVVTRREAIRLTGCLVVGPLFAVAILGMAISAANGLKYGLWSTNQLSAPNYVRLFSSLLAIRPDHPIRFVSVTKDARKRAYAESPTFRELQPFLDGDSEHWTARATRTLTGIGGGEIGAGWFYWALIDAVAAAGHFATPSEAETFYGHAADEIEVALKSGKLPSREALLPYVDPSFSVWLPYLPASALTLAKSLFPSAPSRYPERLESTQPDVIATYDRVANRRTSVGQPLAFEAHGWVLSANSRPLEIQIVGEHGQEIPFRFEPVSRADVKPLVNQDGHAGPDSLGFNVFWSADEKVSNSVRFKVTMAGNGSAVSGPIAVLPLHQGIQLISTDSGAQVFLALDRLDTSPIAKRTAIMRALNAMYSILLALFSAIAIAYLLFLIRRRDLSLGFQRVTCLFVLGIVTSRVLFFAILDASAWSAEQTRYLLPATVLLPIIPAIMLTFGPRRQE
jgi:hypothetical protein